MLWFGFGYHFSGQISAHSSGIRNICFSAAWIFEHILDSSDAERIQLSFAHLMWTKEVTNLTRNAQGKPLALNFFKIRSIFLFSTLSAG
jgi:hypothetical protein